MPARSSATGPTTRTWASNFLEDDLNIAGVPELKPIVPSKGIHTSRAWEAKVATNIKKQRVPKSQQARDLWRSRKSSHTAGDVQVVDNKSAMVIGHDIESGGMLVAYGPATALCKSFDNYQSPCHPLPLSGFERLIADAALKDFDLDALIGVATGHASLSTGLTRAGKSKPISTFLSHVPSRFGYGTCLDDATRCITSKIKSMLADTPSVGSAEELLLYGKALRSIQAALDSDAWAEPEVLCSIIILCIYEVLEGRSRIFAWRQHVFGLTRLIHARGPSRFKTEFEQAILKPMLGWTVYGALCNRQPAVLQSLEWQSVLQSMFQPNVSRRDQEYIVLGHLGSRFATLLVEVHGAVANRSKISEIELDDIELRCRALTGEFAAWLRGCFPVLATVMPAEPTPATQGDLRAEMLSAGTMLHAGACRLLSAVSLKDRVSKELEAVALAKYHRSLLVNREMDKISEFYIEQRAILGESIITSSNIWLQGSDKRGDNAEESVPDVGGKERLIEEWKYQAWLDRVPNAAGRIPLHDNT